MEEGMRCVTLFGVALTSLFMLTGCGPEGEAKSGVKSLLNDPDSVQFSGLRKDSSGKNVCGYFNAKNRMGGYVGRTPFYYEGATTITAIAPPVEESDIRSLWLGIKVGDFSKDLESLRHKCQAARKWPDVCGDSYPGATNAMCDVVLDGGGDKLYQALKEKYDR